MSPEWIKNICTIISEHERRRLELQASHHVISKEYPPKDEIQQCFDNSVLALTGRE